ncbi:MAG TPA: hypothetical protein VEG84_03325 [Thermoanaerobaculia bacterium]|nr:hypothetical protein [Thermoanaerobaculia bacterium]
MRETRAVVLGLFVVILVAIALASWHRPSREWKHVKGYRVEIEKSDGGARRHVSFRVPIGLVARITSLAPISDFGSDFKIDWDSGDLSARDILTAASESAPGKPGVITRGGNKIEVTADGTVIDITIKDDWGKSVQVRVPRALVESLSDRKRISPKDILKNLDEMGPGDIVVVRDHDNEVTITAEAR